MMFWCHRAQGFLIRAIEEMSFQIKKSQKVRISYWLPPTDHRHIHISSVKSHLSLTRLGEWLLKISRKQWGLSARGACAGTHCGSAWRMNKLKALSQVLEHESASTWTLRSFFLILLGCAFIQCNTVYSYPCRWRISTQNLRNPHALLSGHPPLPTRLQARPPAAYHSGTHVGQKAGRLAGLSTLWAW